MFGIGTEFFWLSSCLHVCVSSRSDAIICWAAKLLPQSLFVIYEQIRPNSPFGQIMQDHFLKLNSCLYALREYQDAPAQRHRFLVQASIHNAQYRWEWNISVSYDHMWCLNKAVVFRVGNSVCVWIWTSSTLGWSLRKSDAEWTTWSLLMSMRLLHLLLCCTLSKTAWHYFSLQICSRY